MSHCGGSGRLYMYHPVALAISILTTEHSYIYSPDTVKPLVYSTLGYILPAEEAVLLLDDDDQMMMMVMMMTIVIYIADQQEQSNYVMS